MAINENIMWNCTNKEIPDAAMMHTPPKDQYLDFEEFIEVMKDRMKNEKENMQNCDIVFESHASNVSCLFWPY